MSLVQVPALTADLQYGVAKLRPLPTDQRRTDQGLG